MRYNDQLPVTVKVDCVGVVKGVWSDGTMNEGEETVVVINMKTILKCTCTYLKIILYLNNQYLLMV